MKKNFFALAGFCALFFCNAAEASDEPFSSWWDKWTTNVEKAWNSDKYQLIIPAHTYHSRISYSRENIKKYNENPWGIGLERYFEDEGNVRHSLFALTFQDSWNRPQPTAGYSWQKNWYADYDNDLAVGLGYSLILTARKNHAYVPIPGILPTLSLEYRRFIVQTAWVPYMGANNGNILFTMVKWKL